MAGRLGGLGVVGFWAAMMGWLAWHDLWPAWTAQQPPDVVARGLPPGGSRHTQAGLFDGRGRRIGTVWTSHTRHDPSILREDCLWLDRFAGLPPTRIEVSASFDADRQLDEIEAAVWGHGVSVTFKGERFPRHFVFELQIGHLARRLFKIPHHRAGTFGDMFKPFTELHGLHVGQSWRMQVINPLATITNLGDPFIPVLVQVTGTGRLVRNGAAIECFVVESPGAQAWVGPDGTVYEQSVELPIGGRIVIRDEPYDGGARKRVESLSMPVSSERRHGGPTR